ncbi:hypothetical protein ACGRT8_02500 [Candidatus Phytoplasma australasiaticum]
MSTTVSTETKLSRTLNIIQYCSSNSYVDNPHELLPNYYCSNWED